MARPARTPTITLLGPTRPTNPEVAAAMPAPLLPRVPALLGMLAIVAAGCGAAATPTPAPTPTPTAAPTPTPVDVAAVFLAGVTAASTASLPLTGTVAVGTTEATVGGSLNFAGADSATSLVFEVEGASQAQEMIRVGARKWTREGDGPWVLDPDPGDPTKTLAAYLTSLDSLRDEGVESKDGRSLHHLVPPAGATVPPEALGLDPSIENPTVTVDFWAEDDGTPVTWTVGVAWAQPDDATSIPVEMTLDIDLAGLGKPASVAAPEDAWTGFLSKRFGYQMAYAPGWSVREDDGTDVYLLDGTPYIYVSPQDLAAGYTLERFGDELVAYYEEKDIKASPEADEAYEVDGVPARLLTYRFTNASGNPVFLVDAVTVRGATGWEIYLAQSQTGEEEARAFFDTMVGTFSFEE